MNTQYRNKLTDTENILMVARLRGWGMGGKEEGLRSTNWQLQNSHRDGKYSTGTVVNSVVVTMHGARWV